VAVVEATAEPVVEIARRPPSKRHLLSSRPWLPKPWLLKRQWKPQPWKPVKSNRPRPLSKRLRLPSNAPVIEAQPEAVAEPAPVVVEPAAIEAPAAVEPATVMLANGRAPNDPREVRRRKREAEAAAAAQEAATEEPALEAADEHKPHHG
jgi:ribonuclease E